MTEPVILTLDLDSVAFAYFNRLRRELFPPDRNFLDAHVTLFHRLPGTEADRLIATVEEACAAAQPIPIRVAGVRSLGGGVAYALESEALQQFRARLAKRWEPWLTPQDRQTFRPHITVQNKVPPSEAREQYERLRAVFSSWEITAVGVSVWRYLQGPWSLIRSLPFRTAPDRP